MNEAWRQGRCYPTFTPRLRLDLLHKGVFVLDGFVEVMVMPPEWDALYFLARSAGQPVGFSELERLVETGGWGRCGWRGLRSRLVRHFESIVGREQAETLLPVVPRKGLMLDLLPNQISWSLDRT